MGHSWVLSNSNREPCHVNVKCCRQVTNETRLAWETYLGTFWDSFEKTRKAHGLKKIVNQRATNEGVFMYFNWLL